MLVPILVLSLFLQSCKKTRYTHTPTIEESLDANTELPNSMRKKKSAHKRRITQAKSQRRVKFNKKAIAQQAINHSNQPSKKQAKKSVKKKSTYFESCSDIEVSETSNGTNQLEILMNDAEKGDAEAQYQLGLYYEHGNWVVQDEEQAAELFQMAADQGHAKAQYQLGLCYHQGKGVLQNKEQASEWLWSAAKQGDTDACNLLSIYYANGTSAFPRPWGHTKYTNEYIQAEIERTKLLLKNYGYDHSMLRNRVITDTFP